MVVVLPQKALTDCLKELDDAVKYTVEYVSSAKKITMSGNKIMLPKGLKSGTYSITVKINIPKSKANTKGNSNYKASSITKTISVTIP